MRLVVLLGGTGLREGAVVVVGPESVDVYRCGGEVSLKSVLATLGQANISGWLLDENLVVEGQCCV